MRIPYRPLSERMLQEPFWLGLITVFVVLAVIGLVWCAKRHFPEKIEKLLQEEADRNRRNYSSMNSLNCCLQCVFSIFILHKAAHLRHHHHISLREQLQVAGAANSVAMQTGVPQAIVTTPGTQKSIFGRLGIRKPSILSLSSPQPPHGSSTARTFSLDDLLRPVARRKLDKTLFSSSTTHSSCYCFRFQKQTNFYYLFKYLSENFLAHKKKNFSISSIRF
jgi:hypothetical protein